MARSSGLDVVAQYRSNVLFPTCGLTSRAVVDVLVPECQAQRTNPSFGRRDILGMGFKWINEASMSTGNCQRKNRDAAEHLDSDNHPKLAKGQVMLKVRCYVALALYPLFFPLSLVSWLRRPNLDPCVHLTRRPFLTSSQT